MKRLVLLVLLAVLAVGVANAATIPVAGFGDYGWMSDDTRDGTGAHLVGLNYTHYGRPGQVPTSADDIAIASQLQFTNSAPGGVSALQIYKASGSGAAKSSLSKVDLSGFATGAGWVPGFFARYPYYTDTTGETAVVKIGIQSALWGIGASQSQNGFTATRSGESAWDLVLVAWIDTPVANAWQLANLDANSVIWKIYRQAGNSYFNEHPSQNGSTMSLQQLLSQSAIAKTIGATSYTWADVLFGPGSKVTSVQFGVGSSGGTCTSYIDYLETNLLNDGDRVDFCAAGSFVGPVAPATCIDPVHTCVTVPMNIMRTDAIPARAFSVRFQLSPELMLCSGTGSVTPGNYFNGYNTQWYVTDLGSGAYVADCAIIGVPCGQTAALGTLFDVAVKKASGDGTGTVTVTSVALRGCDNATIASAAGSPVSITIDTTAPVTIANLSASQVKTGNDADGTTKVNLAFTAPTGGGYAGTSIYRKGYGSYPEYDDAGGAVPAVPATPAAALSSGWVLAGTTGSGSFVDETAGRDYWYYVAFSADGCGNVSAVSNMTTGTLNYHLGDVAGIGDNHVSTIDMTSLSNSYGKTSVMGGYDNTCDVGPTTNYSVNGRPTTDNVVNFEDLMMFAINFGGVSKSGAVASTMESPALELRSEVRGDEVVATLWLRGNERSTKGVHAVVGFDRAGYDLVSAEAGSLVSGSGFFKTLDGAAGLAVDVAELGEGSVLVGSGPVAVLRFKSMGAGSAPALVTADLRGVSNERLGSETSGLEPASSAVLLSARPNPFAGATTLRFALAQQGRVDLRVFDASGRLVRTVASGIYAAGEHQVEWDGRNESGDRVVPGVYFYGFAADGRDLSRKIVVLR
jgi:hypothetical protein